MADVPTNDGPSDGLQRHQLNAARDEVFGVPATGTLNFSQRERMITPSELVGNQYTVQEGDLTINGLIFNLASAAWHRAHPGQAPSFPSVPRQVFDAYRTQVGIIAKQIADANGLTLDSMDRPIVGTKLVIPKDQK